MCKLWGICTYNTDNMIAFWHTVNAVETRLNRPLTIAYGTDVTAQYSGLDVAVWLRADGSIITFEEE